MLENAVQLLPYMLLLLFATVVGAIPIIRCPKGNAAEMIAEKLDKKIRDNLRDARNSLFSGDSMPMAQLRYEHAQCCACMNMHNAVLV